MQRIRYKEDIHGTFVNKSPVFIQADVASITLDVVNGSYVITTEKSLVDKGTVKVYSDDKKTKQALMLKVKKQLKDLGVEFEVESRNRKPIGEIKNA